jgi:hypothetical protein
MAEEQPNTKSRIPHNVLSLVGRRYDRWLVLARAGTKQGRTSREKWSTWICRCDCGVTRTVDGGKLTQGTSKSCGCARKGHKRLPGWRSANRLPHGESAKRRLFRQYQRGARQRKLVWELSTERFYELTKMDCHYCGSPPNNESHTQDSNGGYVYNGIDRFDNAIGYTEENSMPCCVICNRAKMVIHGDQFLVWISQLVRHRAK